MPSPTYLYKTASIVGIRTPWRVNIVARNHAGMTVLRKFFEIRKFRVLGLLLLGKLAQVIPILLKI
jgi:hypothetical protein